MKAIDRIIEQLTAARREHHDAVGRYSEAEVKHGFPSDEAARIDREQVTPAIDRVADLESVLAITPAPTITSMLRKMVELTEEAMDSERLALLKSEALRLIESDTEEGRAAFIAETLGVEPPAPIRDGDSISDELSEFCRQTGASLDYILLGDIRPMIWGNFNRLQDARTDGVTASESDARAWSPAAVQGRVDLLAELAGIDPVKVETEDGSVLLTGALTGFCKEAHGDITWLLFGDPRRLVQAYLTRAREAEPLLRETRNLTDAERAALLVALRVALHEGAAVDEALTVYRQAMEKQAA